MTFVDFRIDVKWRCRQESKVLYNHRPYKYLTTWSMFQEDLALEVFRCVTRRAVLCRTCINIYHLFNKIQAAWNFPSPELEVTWRTVAIIILVVLLSPYLCIRGVSVSSIHYNQSRRVYINQRQIHSRNLKLKHELKVINFSRRVAC